MECAVLNCDGGVEVWSKKSLLKKILENPTVCPSPKMKTRIVSENRYNISGLEDKCSVLTRRQMTQNLT